MAKIIMTKNPKRLTGFTLIELLIVLAIIGGFMALLIPKILEQRKKQIIARTANEIQNLQMDLELYSIQHGGYPTTEQGLYALVYIPDAPLNQSGLSGSGMPGGGTYDQSGMLGQGTGVGSEMLNQPFGQPNPMPGGGMPTSGIDPMTSQQSYLTGTFGSPGQGTTGYSAWNQPTHNPQLYTRKQERSDAVNEKRLYDPWNQPYRYDNTPNQYGVNQYGWDARPVIWSAGPDGKDNTDDDIRSWDPGEIPGKQAKINQQMQQQGGGMMGEGVGIGGNMTSPPGGSMPMGPGSSMPIGPGSSMPMGPGSSMPMGPGSSMPMGPGSSMPMGPGSSMPMGPGSSMPMGPGSSMPMGPTGM